MNETWLINEDNKQISFDFKGLTQSGNVLVLVDGKPFEQTPVNMGAYLSARYQLGEKSLEMRVSLESGEAMMFNSGALVPVADRAQNISGSDTNGRVRSGRKTVLGSLTAISFVNVALAFFSIPLSFPYSLFTPYFITASFKGEGYSRSAVLGLCIGLILCLGYLLIYILAKKSKLWYVLGIIAYVLDTFLLLWFFIMSGGGMYFVLDLVFHALAFFGLIGGLKLYPAKKRD